MRKIWIKLRKFPMNLAKNILIIVFFIFLLFNNFKGNRFLWENLIDIPLIFTMSMYIFLSGLNELIKLKTEDFSKLTEDVNELVARYEKENLAKFSTFRLPIIEILDKETFNKKKIVFHYDSSAFSLPNVGFNDINKLLNAHSKSTVYNQSLLRIDNIKINQEQIDIFYSSTTFINSLLTNRSQEVEIFSGNSIRDYYEPGPFLNTLATSKFSNHLGVNIIVITKDNKVIFVKRGKKVSIGKERIGISVGASIKPKYFKNHFSEITIEDIQTSINNEIECELGVKVADCFQKFSLSDNIVSIFRELYEGGKPQILMVAKSNWEYSDHNEQFLTHCTDERKNNMVVDGGKLISIDINDLRTQIENKSHFDKHEIKIKNRKYNVAPTHLAALAFYFEKEKINGSK